MMVFESQQTRRLIGRMERGETVPEAFRRIAQKHDVSCGWIRALGAFEWVELCEYDQQEQRYRPARRFGECEILSLEGNLSLKDGAPFAHVHATVSRETDRGVEVIGGHLTSGAVFACEFTVECYDDLELERQPDRDTGLSLWAREPAAQAPEPAAASGSQPSGGAMSWAQVAAASEQLQQQGAATPPAPGPSKSGRGEARKPAPRPESDTAPPVTPDPLPQRRRTTEQEFFSEPVPVKGDWVEHPKFGLCRIEREDSEGGIVIRLPSGVRKTIRLDYLQVLPAEQRDDRRVFPVKPRRR
jgi:hypothetical protein